MDFCVCVTQSGSLKKTDQHWPWWPLLPLKQYLIAMDLRGMSLSCPWIFVQLGRTMGNYSRLSTGTITDLRHRSTHCSKN